MRNPYLTKCYRDLLLTGVTMLLIIFFGLRAGAQTPTTTPATDTFIEGVVVDDFGQPLSNVSVHINGRSIKALTDQNGHFKLQAAFDDVIIARRAGFDAFRQAVRSGKLIIRLTGSYLERPDTVQVLYGEQSPDRLLGAISTIYNPELITTPASQYSFALPGRMAGLYTQQTSGWPAQSTTPLVTPGLLWTEKTEGTEGSAGPDDNSQMLLSLRGQTPITIIDGVQRDLYSIAPEDIQSVSVLKDALSTILLGQQSSRGVLLVTTKRPVQGPPRVSFTAQTAMQTPLDLPRPLPAYRYAWLYNEALMNDDRKPVYSQEDFQAYRDGSDPTGHPDQNWYKTVLRDQAPMSRYDLGVSGGGDVARYRMGLDYMNKQGLFIQSPDNPFNTNAAINRYTVNSHVDVDIKKYFNVGLDIFGRIENTNQPGATVSGIMNALLTTPNNAYPLFNPDGSLAGNQTYNNNIYGLVNNTGYIAGHNRDVMANLDLKYKFDHWLPGLWAKIKGNISISAADVIDRSIGFPVFDMIISPSKGDTSYTQYGSPSDQNNTYNLTSRAQYWYGQLSVGYDHRFGTDDFSAMLFADQRQVTINYDLPAKYTNLAAKASYSRQDKYFAEVAFNYSGYDRYAPGHRFGLFYAGGVGWDMAREDFMKDQLPWISQLKWRVTYGLTGNANVGYFIYKQYYQDTYIPGYQFGGVWEAGEVEMPLPNPEATWEKAHKLDIGLDVSVFNSRLKLTADYYRNKYYDLMQMRGKDIALLGNAYPLENIGVNLYSGGEASLSYAGHAGGFNWFVTANASVMQTKVLYQDEPRRDYAWNRHTGQPVGALFGYVAQGLYQTEEDALKSPHIDGYVPIAGDIKYKDLNNDGVINQFDQTSIGTTKPLIYYGLSWGFRFKGVDFSLLLQGVQNRDILLTGAGQWSFQNLGRGQAWAQNLGRWTPGTGQRATYPRLTAGFNQNNIIPFTSYWLRSGNYIRLKNIEVGYNLPYKWTRKVKLGSVRFFANALNLFTDGANKGIDPEVSYQTSGAVYPIEEVINMGVTIKF